YSINSLHELEDRVQEDLTKRDSQQVCNDLPDNAQSMRTPDRVIHILLWLPLLPTNV
uniref:Uncharacterized protein n=2 Tax=Aegilops tauschii subsp. strangulata TaxID=200361 RepID=A0A453JWQ7_AEGTS